MQTVGDPDRAVPQSLTLPVSSQAEQLTPANFDQVGRSAHASCIRPALQNPLTKVAVLHAPTKLHHPSSEISPTYTACHVASIPWYLSQHVWCAGAFRWCNRDTQRQYALPVELWRSHLAARKLADHCHTCMARQSTYRCGSYASGRECVAAMTPDRMSQHIHSHDHQISSRSRFQHFCILPATFATNW